MHGTHLTAECGMQIKCALPLTSSTDLGYRCGELTWGGSFKGALVGWKTAWPARPQYPGVLVGTVGGDGLAYVTNMWYNCCWRTQPLTS